MQRFLLARTWCFLLVLTACADGEVRGGSGSTTGGGGGGSVSTAGPGGTSGAASGGDSGSSGRGVGGSTNAGGAGMGNTAGSPSDGSGGSAGNGDAAAGGIEGGAADGMAGSSAGGSGVGSAEGGVDASGLGGFGYAGPSRCATAATQLCESFENGLDAALWTTTRTGDATVVVDEMHAARGSKALHVKTTSGSGHAFITERKTFPADGNTLYARMFIWFEDDITTSGHFSLAEGAGTGNGALIRFGGQFKEFGVGTDGGASGDWTDHDTVVVPSKKWLCVEFQLEGSANAFHVWWDDVARTALNTGANRHNGFVIPQLTSLWFGWWMYNAIEPQDLWIDEIAVDSKPIGCTK